MRSLAALGLSMTLGLSVGLGSLAGQTGDGVAVGEQRMTVRSAEVVTGQALIAELCGRLVQQPTFCRNDMFDARFDLHSDPVVHTTGSNLGYSGELGEPIQSGNWHSAWWQWTAPADGEITVDTFGSDFDTFLTLATGSVIHGLSVITQNDDADPGIVVQSEIVSAVTAGIRYQIAVDGFEDATGAIALRLIFNANNG